jgi:hypothetical protein
VSNEGERVFVEVVDRFRIGRMKNVNSQSSPGIKSK